MLRFPEGDDVHPRIPPNSEWNTITFELFWKISGVVTTNWDALLASHIHNPTIQYFVRILQKTPSLEEPTTSKLTRKNYSSYTASFQQIQGSTPPLSYFTIFVPFVLEAINLLWLED
jgi:hypothetical protein